MTPMPRFVNHEQKQLSAGILASGRLWPRNVRLLCVFGQSFRFPERNERKFGRLAKAAGFKITLHDLRRSFGSRYAAVVPAPVLQRLMRHADIKTTLAFYTSVEDVLGEAILKA
jgi:integrase